jgi:hypothetical protein
MGKLARGRILVGPVYPGTSFRRNAVSCVPFMTSMLTWENSTTSWNGLSLTADEHPVLLLPWISNYRRYMYTHSPVGISVYFAALHSSVGIATGYVMDDRGVGVRVPVRSRIFSLRRPNRLSGSHNLLSSWYRRLFPRGYSSRSVKLTTQLKLVPRSRKYGSIYPLRHTLLRCNV